MINRERLEIANKIVEILCPDVCMAIVARDNNLYIRWQGYRQTITKRWTTARGSFYPPYKISIGGTRMMAIAQLMNWIRDRPALTIRSWEYWCGPNVGMRPVEVLDILRDSDYPKIPSCHWCAKTDGRFDWWTHGKTSALGCRLKCEKMPKEKSWN